LKRSTQFGTKAQVIFATIDLNAAEQKKTSHDDIIYVGTLQYSRPLIRLKLIYNAMKLRY